MTNLEFDEFNHWLTLLAVKDDDGFGERYGDDEDRLEPEDYFYDANDAPFFEDDYEEEM